MEPGKPKSVFEKGVFLTETRPSGSIFCGKVSPLPYGRGSEKVVGRALPNGPKLRLCELGWLLDMPISAVTWFVGTSRIGAARSFADASTADVRQ